MKKDKKINTKFAIIIIIAGLIGGLIGFYIEDIKNFFNDINVIEIYKNLYMPLSIVYALLVVVSYIICLTLYSKAKKKYNQIENETDEIYESEIASVNKKATISSFINTITFLISFIFYPIIFLCFYKLDESVSLIGLIIDIVTFFANMILFMLTNVKLIKLEKKINPNKKGNIFDFKFKKDWLSSMDEAEFTKTANGALKAYMAGIKTGFILWFIAAISMIVFNTGIMPILCISIMLIVMTIAEVRSYLK